MSAFHLVQCVCHGYTFWGHVQDGSQGVDNSSQVDTGIVYLEPVYESEEQQAPVGLPNSSPYQPQISGGLVVMSSSPPVYASGSQLPIRCGCGLCGGPEVPQRPYIPVQTSPDLSQPNGETLSFSKGGCGVPLIDAVKNRLSGLVGGDDLMFVEAPVTTFSLRIEWPGYRLWTGKFRAKNWSGSNGPVTRSRLVSQIGKRIAEFIEAVEGLECSDLAWKALGSRF